jgi:hypothetical protein
VCDGVSDMSALDVEADYFGVLLLSAYFLLSTVEHGAGADGESRVRPPGGRIVRFVTFLGQPRQLTSRGASVSAAADDTNCAAANVESMYFIVASVYGRPVNGLSTWYMCCAGWLAQSEAQ